MICGYGRRWRRESRLAAAGKVVNRSVRRAREGAAATSTTRCSPTRHASGGSIAAAGDVVAVVHGRRQWRSNPPAGEGSSSDGCCREHPVRCKTAPPPPPALFSAQYRNASLLSIFRHAHKDEGRRRCARWSLALCRARALPSPLESPGFSCAKKNLSAVHRPKMAGAVTRSKFTGFRQLYC